MRRRVESDRGRVALGQTARKAPGCALPRLGLVLGKSVVKASRADREATPARQLLGAFQRKAAGIVQPKRCGFWQNVVRLALAALKRPLERPLAARQCAKRSPIQSTSPQCIVFCVSATELIRRLPISRAK